MSKSNKMAVKELAGFLNGVIEAGHGDADIHICLDHGDTDRDQTYDMDIDSVSILNLDGCVSVMLNTYLFKSNIKGLLDSFGYEGLIE